MPTSKKNKKSKSSHKGEILRDAYDKKGYVRKDGIKVHSTHVPASWIKMRGKPGKTGKGPKLITITKKGLLSKFGYHANKSEKERHEALKKSLKIYPALSVYRHLRAIATLEKYTVPEDSKIFIEDADWVKSTPEYKNRPTFKKSKKSKSSRK